MKGNVIIKVVIAIAVIVICAIVCILWYSLQLKPVDSQNIETKIVEIPSGTSTVQIVDLLDENNLIKNTFATKVYIKLNKISKLQAGKYTLNTGMSLKEILNTISSGNVLNEEVKITFLEGKNMRWIASEIEKNTNNTQKDVYELLEDKTYIKEMVNKYWFLTDEIQNENIYYPFEGYLYPDTYTFKNKDVSVKEIFETLLNQTDKVLSKYKNQIQNSKYSVHEILTMASIVEIEGNTSEDRKGIARVFYNRISKNMSLGSDVTTYYGIKVDMGTRNLSQTEIKTYNPYNTRGPNMAGKLPVGPIASVSEEAIDAVLNPVDSNYLYFVADINGKIYFTSNYAEHQKIKADLIKQGLWYQYE